MKINGKEVITNGKFAYDGCHKIYILEDEADEQMMVGYGYSIYPIGQLQEKYANSCYLRFVSNAKLDKSYVEQCKDAEFEG